MTIIANAVGYAIRKFHVYRGTVYVGTNDPRFSRNADGGTRGRNA